ncbi:MAG: hypothetical protein LZF86_10033 [Nitrospira sp.]|nr:MAG: hypothetical protein LZF86_10033 [Nitrospira sp.]
MRRRWRGSDDFLVIASLAVAFGMIVGAAAALWIASSGPGPVAWWLP